MTNLNKFKKLSARQRNLLIQSVWLLPLIHTSLCLVGYSSLKALLEKIVPIRPSKTSLTETEVFQSGRELSRIVSIASRHGLYRATCLRNSILVWLFLRVEGIPSEICFGVRVDAQKLEAHAWVETQGMVLNEEIAVREKYKPLQNSLPATKLGL